MKRSALALIALLLMVGGALAQTPGVRVIDVPPRPQSAIDYEDHLLEFTLTYWPFKPSGRLRTEFIPADLNDDLGVEGWKSHPAFRLVVQPKRRHKIVLEGIPYRLNGGNTLERPILFAGRSFLVTDEVETRIKLNYAYAGYQYDFVSRPGGHAGLNFGAAYLEANARLRSVTRGIDETSHTRLVAPLLGLESRVYLSGSVLSISGELKGMHFGNYGHYLHSAVGLGISPAEFVTLQLGISMLDTDFHDKHDAKGVNATFVGPTVSVQVRPR